MSLRSGVRWRHQQLGVLTILDSTVSDNSAGSAGTSSDAEGAGICSSSGSVTLTNTVMSGNHAVATGPNGRWAEGGAVNIGCMGTGESDSLTVMNSAITDNTAVVTSNLPVFYLGSGPFRWGRTRPASMTASSVSGHDRTHIGDKQRGHRERSSGRAARLQRGDLGGWSDNADQLDRLG